MFLYSGVVSGFQLVIAGPQNQEIGKESLRARGAEWWRDLGPVGRA